MAGELVLVDDREPDTAASRICDYGQKAVVSRLPFGDYAIYPHGLVVLVERKTISDLLGSMADKRLVAQVHGMLDKADRAFLLREGAFRRDPSGKVGYYSPRHPKADREGWVESGWNWDSFSGIMTDLQLLGVGFIDCPVLGEYPREIARFAAAISQKEHSWIRERKRPRVVTIDSQYEHIVWSLAALPRIGVDWVEALLQEYRTYAATVDALANRSEEVAKVLLNGRALGVKRAEHLREVVLTDYKESGN